MEQTTDWLKENEARILTERFYLAGQGDYFDSIAPGVLQNALQAVATRHAEMAGAARETLPGQAIWVMTKSLVWLRRPLERLKPVDASTWFRGFAGVQFIRDFDICQDGERVGEAVTAWVVYDQASGRILRPASCGLPNVNHVPPEPKTRLPGRLNRPENMEEAGTRTVMYSDLDMNRHMNNTRFADMACDALELWRHPRGFVQSAELHYIAQCMPGETLRLERADMGGGRCFVSASGEDGKRKFDALLDIP